LFDCYYPSKKTLLLVLDCREERKAFLKICNEKFSKECKSSIEGHRVRMKDHGVGRGIRFVCNENCCFQFVVSNKNFVLKAQLEHIPKRYSLTQVENVKLEQSSPSNPITRWLFGGTSIGDNN